MVMVGWGGCLCGSSVVLVAVEAPIAGEGGPVDGFPELAEASENVTH